MIIIASKEGAFANRVIHFAHIYSFCKVRGIALHHSYFNDYLECFPNLESDPAIHVWGNGLMARCGRKLVNLLARILIRWRMTNLGVIEVIPYLRYDQEAPVYDLSKSDIGKKAKRKIVILFGWLFRDPVDFERLLAQIEHLFLLPEDVSKRADAVIKELKEQFDVVAAIHIRKGDYKRFENGRWYYEDAVYREKMEMFEKCIRMRGKTVVFVLCSNEAVRLEEFKPFNVRRFGNDFLMDFLLLQKADYIIGPPSTFSALASFWGKVGLQHINSKEEVINLEKFSVYSVY